MPSTFTGISNVDITQTTTLVSLCTGYGGIDLGLKRAIPNLRTIALCEIEAFAAANLVAKMEAGLMDIAPIWTNLKTFPWQEFRDHVGILTAGYPCQPFSAAGKRLGTEDPRHLWPFIADGINSMRPALCFFENVEGHISMGLSDVMQDLGRLGYRSTWQIFSASEVGAVHQRKRVFIMAYRIDAGSQRWLQRWANPRWEDFDGYSGCGSSSTHTRWPSRPGQPQYEWEPPRVVANSKYYGQLAGSLGGGSSEAVSEEQEGEDDSFDPQGTSSVSAPQGDVMEDSQLVGWRGRDHGNEGGGIRQVQASGSCGSLGNPELFLFPATGEHGAMAEESGDATEPEWSSSPQACAEPSASRERKGHGIYPSECHETQSSLGGSPHGSSSGVVHAELYVSCDNRTDELRLLGNGVVSQTAELAFKTLIKELHDFYCQ